MRAFDSGNQPLVQHGFDALCGDASTIDLLLRHKAMV
jgi:hypothetical protein